MDYESQSAVQMLGALQGAMQRLTGVWNHYTLRGNQPQRPYLVLSGRPFGFREKNAERQFQGSVALGLEVRGGDRRNYDLSVDLLWNAQCWTITTQAWRDSEEKNQELLRELPERMALDLGDCMRQLHAAIDDLIQFEDLVPCKSAA